ncbi:MAG: chemotaxis protein CheW [Ekhidna sp.]|uniref:chemotaxis protein CheW n=1 Tax=Ekhidna sp. TaxID=2608089 RepID=UPI0032EEA7BA
MALGNNLKKKKLIEDKKEAPKEVASKSKSKTSKKKKQTPSTKKKQLIKKPTATKPAKKTTTKKKESKPKAAKKQKAGSPQGPDQGLPIFIAQELKERKNELRRRYEQEVAQLHGKMVQFVVFEVGGESYAVDIDCVKEVVAVPSISKTPNTPAHVLGIANVRGKTYVVFDLATKFKVTTETFARYLMIVNHDGIKAGLTLGLLPTTFKVNGDNISSAFHMIEDASLDVSYIRGLIQHEEKLIYYLDVIELLKNDKAIVVPDKLAKTK